MIPGRNACYNGWNLEYRGVLVSGYYEHRAASTYICLDEKPEIVDGGAADQNGKFYIRSLESVDGCLELSLA
jgi:hypothetical protein